jgi:hypothetical protein
MNRYHLELGAALILYMLVLTASLIASQYLMDAHLVLRSAVALTPIIPAALMCWAIVRNMRRMDEMHLRIQFEALGFAFAASALVTFSYGFLENVGAPHIPWTCVWPVMGLMWSQGIARRAQVVAGRSGRTPESVAPDDQRHRKRTLRSEPAIGVSDCPGV